MNDTELRQLVADTGRRLLNKGLVARTWGNISARKDATKFAISPSGLGYEHMQGSDVPIYDMEVKTWEGSRKPSSEKKIHAAAYKLYPEVNFVIHTHQDFATAIGLASVSELEPTSYEKELLGEISIAGYGLPGTDKLANNVTTALKNSQVVLMAHHGALILGKDVEDAMKKAEVLEEVCKRAVIKKIGEDKAIGKDKTIGEDKAIGKDKTIGKDKAICEDKASGEDKTICEDKTIGEGIDEAFGGATDKASLQALPIDMNSLNALLDDIPPFKAQLDDMAQMIGPKLSKKAVAKAIEGLSDDDIKALYLLLKKAIISKKYTNSLNLDGSLSSFDCILMRTVYKFKYSKQKNN